MNLAMMTRASLMAAVTAVAAQISIPVPPVPFTLQVFAVILSGLLLGPRWGTAAMATYLLVGAVGVPVFANFSGGLDSLVGPTGGYLASYPFAAALAGLATGKIFGSSRGRALLSGFAWGTVGLAIIYALGATWLAVVTQVSPAVALAQGVLPFVIFDLIKVGLAAAVAVAAAPAVAPSRT